MKIEQTTAAGPEATDALAEAIRCNRRSPEEVARMAEGRPPFDYDEWVRTAPPATPEELAETEEFLCERELERQASIAAELGVRFGRESGRDSHPEPPE